MGWQAKCTATGGSLIGAMLIASVAPADALTLWTKGFRPTGDVGGNGRVVREWLDGVGCSKGNRLTIEVTLTQGDVIGTAERELQCDGEVRSALVVIHADAGRFAEGPAHVEAIATERDRSGAVVGVEHRSPDIMLRD